MGNNLLSAKATLPVYDRNNLAPRIVHLGFGAFHRAHQGVYADILATEHFSDWGYYEVNLIGGEQQIADLQQQDNLYTVAEMSADAWTARVVGVVKKALHVQIDGLETVLAAMCEPQILGFGAFHRAHQGVYADILATEHFSDWGYYEVNLIGGEQQIADLQQQDNLYTVAEMSADAWTARVVGVVKKALHVQIDGLETVLAAMCEPQIAIVSLTITEKGYFHSPATGQLMLDHPMVAADVQNPHQPKTATGVIVEALARRKAAGLPAFTVMSCDNMPENGHVMRDVVTSYAQAVDVKLAQWIEDNVTFPSTMVDRIVPAVTEDTLAKIEQLTGVRDPAGVACEPFRQWVIEDNFVAGRPEWEKAGAELVSDVLPYEEMKLRMLNGSHSFLAYLGYLAGYQHINDCMEDEHYRHAAYGLMLQEQAPTLKVQGVDLQDYANRLIARYSNPALRHRTWQIAMDGSQKLPQRMLDSVRWHLAHDSKFDLLALGVAGWMRYVGGVDEQGNPIEISDPLLPVIQKAVQSSAEGKARVQSLLAIKAIFGDDLPDNSLFTAKVTEAYLSLLAHGAKATVAKYSVK
ncbi:mannitol dehydrogenase family protein [Escherichia coli]|nr:mannitol dehydrogenase family protein [Escherichia coli]MED8293659.1 mannitol dehydrogenase family protein [Escherichia coli]